MAVLKSVNAEKVGTWLAFGKEVKAKRYIAVFAIAFLSGRSSPAQSPTIIPWTNHISTNAALKIRCNETERIEKRVAYLVAKAQMEKAIKDQFSQEHVAVLQEQYNIARNNFEALEAELKTRGHIHEWVPETNNNDKAKAEIAEQGDGD